MRKQVLRTSAIALGVAAALPATAQEWNVGWGGYMRQYVVFGSTEQKTNYSKTTTTTYDSDDISISVSRMGTVDGGDVTGTNPLISRSDHKINLVYVAEDDWPESFGIQNAGTLDVSEDDYNVRLFNLDVTDSDNTDANGVYILDDGNGLGGNDVVKENDRVYLMGLELTEDGIESFVEALQGHTSGVSDIHASYAGYGETTIFYTGDREEFEKAVGALTKTSDPEAVNEAIVDQSGVSQKRDTEIHFKPSVTLENGFTFGAVVELEADNTSRGSGAHIDESYMTISSDSLGKFVIGSEVSVGSLMMTSAPGVTAMWTNGGIQGSFLPGGYKQSGAGYESAPEVGGARPMRISYMTPSLGGLTLGVSYASDGNTRNNDSGYLKTPEGAGDISDIVDIAASFNQSLGEASVTLAARYGTAKQHNYGNLADEKPRELGIGLQVEFGAFTIGGSYSDSERFTDTKTELADDSSDGWSLGAVYDMDGPWKFGIDTYQGEWDNGGKLSISKIGATRNLGPGVNWDLFAVAVDRERKMDGMMPTRETATETVNGISVAGTATTRYSAKTFNESGTLFGTAINLSF